MMTIRLEDLTVGEVMTPAPYCLPEDASLTCAVQMLSDLHLSGAPVVDQLGTVVGVVSTSDLLAPVEGLLQGSLSMKDLPDLRIADLATRPAMTVRPEMPLVDACRVMGRTGVHRLVVVGDGGSPVGMVTTWDAAAAFGRLEELEAAPQEPGPTRSW